MPRRRREPKEPAIPVVYEVDSEIESTISRLVRLNPVQFGWTVNFRIGGVMVRGGKPKEEGGCVILARFVKVPPLWHGLTGYDAIVRIEDWAWRRLAPAQCEALVAHELCHGSMSEKGALRVMKHEVEEFNFVVRKYGAWQEHIALFDRQLAMFEPGLGTATEGEQQALEDDGDPRPKGEVNVEQLRGDVDRATRPESLADATNRRLRKRSRDNGGTQPGTPAN